MSGISRDPCEQPPPSLSLIRLFIRASASRFGTRKRALWIVNNELLEKYSIDASLSESDSLIIDMARARRIKARKRESLKQKKIIGSSNFAVMPKQPSTSNINIPNNLSKEKLKFPVLDEFVPLEKLAESSPWPVPKSFGQSTIKDQNLIADLLSLWQFFQAFSTNLSLESHSLFSLLSGFELQTHPNAIIESVFTSFLKQFVRIQRSHKRRIKRIALDYLESKLKSNITTQEECLDSDIADDNHNDTNSLRSPSNLPLELKSNGADEVSVRTNEHPESVESNGHAAYRIDNDSQFIQETIKKTKNLSIDRDVDVPRIGKDNEQDRSDSETSSSSPFEYLSKVDWTKDGSKPWYHKVASLLSQLYIIPQIELALLQMSSSKINFYQLPGATKLKVAVVFQELLVTAVSLRSFVEKEVELGSEATQSLRDLELERKRIIKELTELEGLQSQTEDEKSKEIPLKPSSDKIDSNKVNKNIKKLNQLIASLDRQIKKANSNIHMHSAVRIRYLGEDRFYRRYWWPDAHLASSDFPPSNSCGVLLVETSKASQSPYASKCFEPNHYIDLSDKFSVEQKDNTYDVCRVDVVGDGTMQNIQTEIQEMSSRLDNGDEWRLYDSIEEIDSLFAFLSPYGCREAKLGIALSKIRPLLEKNISNAWLKQSKGIKGISLTKSESVKVALSKDNISRRLLIESEESETSHPVSKKSVYLESESADENDERTIGSRRSKRKAELTTSISLEKRTKEVATRKSSRRHPA